MKATEKQKAQFREYQQKNKEKIKERKRRNYNLNREKFRLQKRIYYQRIGSIHAQERKREVLSYYSNGKCICAKCNEARLVCLTIDHINGGGTQHRKKIKGVNIYYWLKKNGYPEGYQVLCMNCQFIKRTEEKEWRRIIP